MDKYESRVAVSPAKRVKIIFHKKNAMLVEYQDAKGIPMRVSVPMNRVTVVSDDGKTGEISESALKSGIPYGIPWAGKLSDINIKSEEIEEEFRRQGIWTISDVAANAQTLQGVIMAVMQRTLQEMRRTLSEYASKEK